MADSDAAAPAEGAAGSAARPPSAPAVDAAAQLRSPGYARLLLLAALIGVPISAAAYFFLQFVGLLQGWVFTGLPRALGFGATPLWWPLPVLGLAGVLVGVAIRHLPGGGGHSPAGGFVAGGAPTPAELPGVLFAALASLGLGVVLGPEAPLIALGAGLAICAVRLARATCPKRWEPWSLRPGASPRSAPCSGH